MAFEKLSLFFLIGLAVSCSPASTGTSNRVSKSAASTNPAAVQKIGEVPYNKSEADIFCIDEQRCWLWDATNLWQSSDGCRTWSLAFSTQIDKAPNKYEFLSNRDGWAITRSTLLRTVDSGRSWLQQPTPLDGQGEIRALAFLRGSDTIWLAGGLYRSQKGDELKYGVPNNAKDVSGTKVLEEAIFRTDDGGKRWRNSSVASPSIGRILGIRFSDHSHGVAFGERSIYYTGDAGDSWKLAEFNKRCVDKEFLSDTYEGQPTSVYMLDSKLAWASYNDGRVLKSDDGGRSWCGLVRPGQVKFEETGSHYFTAIQFADAEHGWALGWDKYLYETRDSGSTWTRLTSDIRFEALFLLESDYGLLLSTSGVFRLPVRIRT